MLQSGGNDGGNKIAVFDTSILVLEVHHDLDGALDSQLALF